MALDVGIPLTFQPVGPQDPFSIHYFFPLLHFLHPMQSHIHDFPLILQPSPCGRPQTRQLVMRLIPSDASGHLDRGTEGFVRDTRVGEGTQRALR